MTTCLVQKRGIKLWGIYDCRAYVNIFGVNKMRNEKLEKNTGLKSVLCLNSIFYFKLLSLSTFTWPASCPTNFVPDPPVHSRPMSDLAPFVAATLRDKVIYELLEENKKLQERVRASMTVEITGQERQPIYCRGQFDKDGEYHGNPNLWNIKFSEQLHGCPLKDLKNVEIWIGGTLRATFEQRGFSNLAHIMDDGKVDNDGINQTRPDNEKERIYTAIFQPGSVWLDINIGWTNQELDAQNLHFPHDEMVEPGEESVDFICERLAEADSEKFCRFKTICPAVQEEQALLESVPGATNPEVLE